MKSEGRFRDRPALLLVPALDGTGHLFYRQVALLQRRFEVTIHPLRDEVLTLDELVADLHARVSQVAPAGEPVVLVGESFGGALVLHYALEHPQRVTALVLVGAFPYVRSRLRLWLVIQAMRFIPWRLALRLRRVAGPLLRARDLPAEDARRQLDVAESVSRDGCARRLLMLQAFDVRDRLGEIEAPVLIVAADRDRVVPAVKEARFMASRVRRSAVRVLAGQAHVCLIHPAVDLQALLESWPETAELGGRSARP